MFFFFFAPPKKVLPKKNSGWSGIPQGMSVWSTWMCRRRRVGRSFMICTPMEIGPRDLVVSALDSGEQWLNMMSKTCENMFRVKTHGFCLIWASLGRFRPRLSLILRVLPCQERDFYMFRFCLIELATISQKEKKTIECISRSSVSCASWLIHIVYNICVTEHQTYKSQCMFIHCISIFSYILYMRRCEHLWVWKE